MVWIVSVDKHADFGPAIAKFKQEVGSGRSYRIVVRVYLGIGLAN